MSSSLRWFGCGLVAVLWAAGCASGSASDLRPSPAPRFVGTYLARAHAHNDFERRRPLADALERGFASIEVDVALRSGTLYVTHDSTKIDPAMTLVDLYLEPLRTLANGNGGSVYSDPSSPPLQLLVDVKSDGDQAYEALESLLEEYDSLVTRWSGTERRVGAVTVVISGNRARDRLAEDPDRRVALDGRIWEDRDRFPPSMMPLVSINWDDTEKPGDDWPSADRMEIARLFIERVHAEGRRVRFWNTPDRKDVWAWLTALGVDYIGTDDAAGLEAWLSPTTGAIPAPMPD